MNIGTPVRIVYFGTPEFAVPALERLANDGRFSIELVVTQPDRPAGRGRQLTASPVKHAAQRFDLPIYQPESLRTGDSKQPIRDTRADLFIVAAYGKIFGRGILEMPRLGCVNLHASLLPRYRGASPVPAAILCGDRQTGVTLMKMAAGLDSGPTLASDTYDISHKTTTQTALNSLAHIAAGLVARDIPRYVAGEIVPEPQPTEGVSIVRPLVRADGWLDWSRAAGELERRVRAMWPWPRAWTTIDGQPLQIHSAHVDAAEPQQLPGTVIQQAAQCAIACEIGYLVLDTVQPAGSRPMPGAALFAGRRVRTGDQLGIAGAPSVPSPLIEWLDQAGNPVATGCRS